MPELPEVENVRLGLAPVIGQRITRAELFRLDIISPRITKGDVARVLLEGATLDRVDRRGKQLALIADDGRALGVHLGMTGELSLTQPQSARTKHEHARWTFESGLALAFRDPRRFGGFRADALDRIFAALGPDALNIDATHLYEACRRSTRTVKAALLDQSILAGVGNIYADESLFRAGIRPTRRCVRVSVNEWERLAAAIRGILAQAIMSGGSTISDYRKPDGAAGTAQNLHLVYGRSGEACFTCRTNLRSALVAQRTTVWCPSCQR